MLPIRRSRAEQRAARSEQRVAERQRMELAVEVLAGIAPARRIFLVLHEVCEVSIVEIAAALGINYNTACNRLRLARRDYRAAVKRMRPEQRRAPTGTAHLANRSSRAVVWPPPPTSPAPPTPAPPTWVESPGRLVRKA